MKIAVCGTSVGPIKKDILRKSWETGAEIARKKHILVFGGCLGYPYEAAKGAYANKGKVIAISPAKGKSEHVKIYGFPTDSVSEIRYTGLGIPERNLPLVKGSDAIIIIAGQIGTLNEFTIAFYQKKRIGILKNSGGITDIIGAITYVCDNEKYKIRNNIAYSEDPIELVKKLISL